MPVYFLILTAVVVPIAVGFLVGLGSDLKSTATHVILALIAVALALALAAIVLAYLLRNDHELLFGGLTICAALSTLSVYCAFSSFSTVEDSAAWLFLTLVGLSVTTLTLIAHDWARRSFMIAVIIVAAGLSVFIVRVGFESLKVPPQWNRDQIADRAHAYENALYLQDSHPKKVSTYKLDSQICLVDGKNRPPKGKYPAGDQGPDCVGSRKTITSNTDWVIQKHRLDIDLASYRYAVTELPADRDARQQVLDQQPDVDEDISVLTAIENGPDTLWRSVTHSAGPALVPGPLGWVVLGALALGLLAWWGKINASQLAGPVVLPETSEDDGDKDLNTVLRVAVLRNLPEPGASPGASSTSPVTNLLDIVGGPLTMVSKIVQTVLAVTGRRYGYQINIDVATTGAGGTSSGSASTRSASSGSANSASPGSAGTATGAMATSSAASPGTTTALIRVIAISGGGTLRSRLFSSSDPEEAVRSAGLWAAGFILARSTRVPSWAAWNADTADALAVAGEQKSLTLLMLQKALQGAPDSGILLVLLGHYYELNGQDLNALSCYARAVAAHPRYLVARYRLAATVASLRYYPKPISLDDLRVLGPAISAMKVKIRNDLESYLTAPTGARPALAPMDFAALAQTFLKRLANDMQYKYRLVSAMRRSERDYVWPGLEWSSSTAASRFRQLVDSARWAVQARSEQTIQHPKALNELRKAANKPASWWQISYNAACGYASCVTVDPAFADEALGLLEQTLVHPGIYQLTAEWVRKDPDLQAISRAPRFRWFADQLRAGD